MELQVQKLGELNAMKSGFIGMASHEFRTPLTSMLSGTALIKNYARPGERDKMEKHLTRIKSSIYRLITILDEVFICRKAGERESRDHQGESGFAEPLREYHRRNNCNPEEMPDRSVFADVDPEIASDDKTLQHIILNLLSNATKYSAEGMEIKVSTQVTDQLLS